MKTTIRSSLLLLAVSAASTLALAGAGVQVQSTAYVKVAEGAPNKFVLKPAESASPGALVTFANKVTNASKAPAKDIVVQNKVPEHMQFVGLATAVPAKVTYSLDGVTFAPEGALKVTKVDRGVELTRVARASEFKFVRWVLSDELPVGQSVEVGFEARLE